MTLDNLRKELEQNKLRDYYIFAGDEYGLQVRYQQLIYNTFETVNLCPPATIKIFESVKELLDSGQHQQGIMGVPTVCMVINDKEFLKDDRLQQKLKTTSVYGTIIIKYLEVDKRLKFFKDFKDSIFYFEPLPRYKLMAYIQSKVDVSDDVAEAICEYANDYLYPIEQEIHKMLMFGDIKATADYDSLFDVFEHEGLIADFREPTVFDWVDAISSRKPIDAVRIANTLFKKEKAFGAISLLFMRFKQLYSYKDCKKYDMKASDWEKLTGMTAWQVKQVSQFDRFYKKKEIQKILRILVHLDLQIKSGLLEENDIAISLPYIIENAENTRITDI